MKWRGNKFIPKAKFHFLRGAGVVGEKSNKTSTCRRKKEKSRLRGGNIQMERNIHSKRNKIDTRTQIKSPKTKKKHPTGTSGWRCHLSAAQIKFARKVTNNTKLPLFQISLSRDPVSGRNWRLLRLSSTW